MLRQQGAVLIVVMRGIQTGLKNTVAHSERGFLVLGGASKVEVCKGLSEMKPSQSPVSPFCTKWLRYFLNGSKTSVHRGLMDSPMPLNCLYPRSIKDTPNCYF